MPAGGLLSSSEPEDGRLAVPQGLWLADVTGAVCSGAGIRRRASRWLGLGPSACASLLTCQDVTVAQKPLLWSGSEILPYRRNLRAQGTPSDRTILLPAAGSAGAVWVLTGTAGAEGLHVTSAVSSHVLVPGRVCTQVQVS